MTKKSYAWHVATIVGVSLALLLFIYILVAHHRTMPDRVLKDRGALLATGARTTPELAKPVGEVSAPSAETKRKPAKKAKAAPPPSPR